MPPPATPDPDGEADLVSGVEPDGGADLDRVASLDRGAGLDPGADLDAGRGSTGAAGLEGGADLDELARTAGTAARRFSGAVAGTTFVVLHGVVLALVLSLGLVAPPWAVAALLALWLVVAVVGWRGRARHPLVTMLLPMVTAGLVVGALVLGGQVLGWSA